jgi:hypothetical protein
MDKTLIEKLQQIERVKLYDLLCDVSIWNSVDVTYHPPHVERLWCQLGKYRLFLHFIHPCKPGEPLFHPHPWPSVIHVIEGEYEMGMGFGEGLEEPEIFSTIVSQGSMYYDMPHRDGWHYVRPTTSVCSSVMLIGEPWGREMPASEQVGELGHLHNDRVVMMLEYFKGKYRHTVKNDNILEEIKRKDWVMLDEKKMDKDDYEEYGHLVGIKGFVIKNTQNDGLSIRFGNDRYDEFNPAVLMKLTREDE